MPFLIKMPSLSPTMKSGKIASWCNKEGDKIEAGDIIAEIETDKATMEFEAFESGKLYKIIHDKSDEQIEVGQVIGILQLDDDEENDLQEAINNLGNDTKISSIHEDYSEKSIEADQVIKSDSAVIAEVNSTEKRIKISPVAKVIARQNNLNIKNLHGTGPYNRIIKVDVLKAIDEQKNIIDHSKHLDAHQHRKANESLEPSTMRQVIAQRLVESKQNIPHFYLTVECMMDNLLDLRKKINDENTKITINDFIIKATASSLADFPDVNSSWQNNKIIKFGNVDVAVAVSIENGLITPIIQNTDCKSMQVISNEMKELIKKAKENKLQPHEFQGGSCTISNMGMLGVTEFQAIINPPQASILAIGSTKKELLIDESGQQIIQSIMKITLSVDHRVIDGALAANFVRKIKFYLENPWKMLL